MGNLLSYPRRRSAPLHWRFLTARLVNAETYHNCRSALRGRRRTSDGLFLKRHRRGSVSLGSRAIGYLLTMAVAASPHIGYARCLYGIISPRNGPRLPRKFLAAAVTEVS